MRSSGHKLVGAWMSMQLLLLLANWKPELQSQWLVPGPLLIQFWLHPPLFEAQLLIAVQFLPLFVAEAYPGLHVHWNWVPGANRPVQTELLPHCDENWVTVGRSVSWFRQNNTFEKLPICKAYQIIPSHVVADEDPHLSQAGGMNRSSEDNRAVNNAVFGLCKVFYNTLHLRNAFNSNLRARLTNVIGLWSFRELEITDKVESVPDTSSNTFEGMFMYGFCSKPLKREIVIRYEFYYLITRHSQRGTSAT